MFSASRDVMLTSECAVSTNLFVTANVKSC